MLINSDGKEVVMDPRGPITTVQDTDDFGRLFFARVTARAKTEEPHSKCAAMTAARAIPVRATAKIVMRREGVRSNA